MSRFDSIFHPHHSKKTLNDIQFPNDFQFHYQKFDNECFDQMSPTSTCPSEGKSTYSEYQSDQKNMETQMHQSYQQKAELGRFKGNLLAGCLEKYSKIVSDYIKECLDQNSDNLYEFVLVKEFQGLDLQKQQFSNILRKYLHSISSTNPRNEKCFIQNSTLRMFMEEITYLNYEQINFELICLITEIYGFKLSGKSESREFKEFFDRLSKKNSLQYINFKFMNQKLQNKKRQQSFLYFLEQLYQIVSELYIHYNVFQTEQEEFDGNNQPEINRNQVKLFSSQRDMWDSDEDDEFLRLSCPIKKVKYLN